MSFNPKTWSRRNQIIGGVVTVLLVAVAVAPSPDDDVPTVIESAAIDTTPPVTAPPTTAPPTTAPPTTAPPTTAPPTTAPPTTAPPVTAPPVTAAPAFTYCGIAGPGISEDALFSTLDTIGFGGEGSEYCDGFAFVYYQRDNSLVTDLCDAGFWDVSDEYLLHVFMSPEGGSNSHDTSVGMIDGLWTAC
jgi:hypothetical protein